MFDMLDSTFLGWFYTVFWYVAAIYGGIRGFKYFCVRVFNRATASILDSDKYYYIPYTRNREVKDGNKTIMEVEDRVITIRKPSNVLEWTFVIGFVGAVGAAIFAMSRACSSDKKLEAKRQVVKVYSKYVRMSLFCVLFPMTCNNSSNEIVEFCSHVSNYYRMVCGLTNLLGDATSIFDDLFVQDEYSPENGQDFKFQCVHANDCDMRSSTTPCNEVCGGHYCSHSFKCSPELKCQAKEDEDIDMLDEPSVDEIMNDGTSVNETILEAKIQASQEKFESILAQQEAARERLLRGETHFGLGYNRDYAKPSGVWRRLKDKLFGWFGLAGLLVFGVKQRIILLCVKYRWWLAGGASIAAFAGLLYVICKPIGDLTKPTFVAEGGKKRNIGKKKVKSDTKQARAAASTAKPATHAPSGGTDNDVAQYERYLRRQEENEVFARQEAEDYERRWAENKGSTGILYKDMDRKQLFDEIKLLRTTWFEGKNVGKRVQEKRDALKVLYAILNEKFPKQVRKPEHFVAGSLPFTAPIIYAIRAFKHGVALSVTGLAYNGCIYVPRHGLAGAERVVLMNGGKEIGLEGKGVIITSRPDWVQFPLPAGVRQSKGLKFRAPTTNEIATLFWVRTNTPTEVQQTVGTIGSPIYLGKDRKLCAYEYSATTEDGSCGGVYIAASDGYCIGVHGIGSDKPTSKPLFYPMVSGWQEIAKDAANQIPNYKPSEDGSFYEKVTAVINGKADLMSLNL